MVLEATVICLDNSDYMRNGDYTPTRLEAQHDAINLICSAKTESNPESAVAAVACAGRSPEVLVTLTSDPGKLLSALHSVKVTGPLNFNAGIQVAQLVLKHRQNKNQHQRIICFVGSPITSSTEDLVRLAKRLKKNNVAVDIVNFGEQEDNTEKLEAFINAINSNDNSHLVNIPPGPHILSDIILSSPIITGGEGGGAGGVAAAPGGSTAANDFAMYGGIDPNLDPELALVMKISLEEARARQESEKPKTEEGAKPEQTTTTTGATTTTTTQETEMAEAEMDDELSAALAMSIASKPAEPSATKPQAPATTPAPQTTTTTTAVTKDEEMEIDDPEMALALQMSMTSNQTPSSTGSSGVDLSSVMSDPNFVNSVLGSLPGVDPNDDTIKNVLASISKPPEKKDDKDKK